MKITSSVYKIEKVVIGTKEFELNDKNPTYLNGKSGGSYYVAAFIPEWIDQLEINSEGDARLSGIKCFLGFHVISSTREREGRIFLSIESLHDWSYLNADLRSIPHAEDILNWFTDTGEAYHHRVSDELDFLTTIREWRKLN